MAKSYSKAISFFGIVQRIYVLFSGSIKRWNVLLEHVPDLTVKSLSNTRWESRIKSVRAIRYQAPQLRSALLWLSEDGDTEAKARSDAKNLYDVLGSFEFILGMVIWYDILYSVNIVSKKLQSPSTCIDSTLQHIEDGSSNVDINDMISELAVMQSTLPDKPMPVMEIFEFVTEVDCYPNISIAYRILFPMPMTVASAERTFSKLKLLKNYLRSIMSQERLNGLATLCIEKKLLDEIDIEAIINDFAAANVRRNF
ncbi:uncharacterized protein [Miscanthus floridulus]|uniref:uncharacterized protein n=1 Tax=Miscanthus floridulus TaxID=154761 RepID=UPI003457CAFF